MQEDPRRRWSHSSQSPDCGGFSVRGLCSESKCMQSRCFWLQAGQSHLHAAFHSPKSSQINTFQSLTQCERMSLNWKCCSEFQTDLWLKSFKYRVWILHQCLSWKLTVLRNYWVLLGFLCWSLLIPLSAVVLCFHTAALWSFILSSFKFGILVKKFVWWIFSIAKIAINVTSPSINL